MSIPIQPSDLQFTTREYYLYGGDNYAAGNTLSFQQLDTTLIFLSNSIATVGTSFVGLTTASVNLNTINFSKSNGTTFSITVDTGSGQIYTAGDGIDIINNNISSKILTVNSVGPTNGNISLSITNTITGPSSSLSGSPFFLPDTYSPRPPVSGTIFVVSGDTDTNKNGEAYIFVTSSAQPGSWQQIFGFNETTADLRYVRLSSDTSQNIISSLRISGSTTFSGSLFWSGASNLGGAANNVLVLGTDGQLYITGAYGTGGSGGPANPGSPFNSIQFNNAGGFGGSSNLTFDGNNTVNLTGSLILSGSTPLRVIGTGSVTGSIIISRSIEGTPLTIIGTGSSPILNVVGSTGNILQAYDKVSGDLFTVGDYPSGLPILRVTSNRETFIGNSSAPGLYNSFITSSVNTGNHVVYQVLTSSYNALWVDYSIYSGSDFRAGTFNTMWSGSTIRYVDMTGSNFGNTNNLTFSSSFSASYLQVTASIVTTNGWFIKGIIRVI
jgi:hypothetical protein